MGQSSNEPSQRRGRHAFSALICANCFLAFGPWMVRLADVGPGAAAFWRMALAAPILAMLAFAGARRRSASLPPAAILGLVALGGLFFAADLASWHYGIVRTKLTNATLFGNVASLLFPLYGILVLRQSPRATQAAALLVALIGAMLLLGSSYELSDEHLVGDLLALLAGAFYAGYLIVIDRARFSLAPLSLLALSTLASTLPLLVFAYMLGERIMPHDWTSLVLLALGSQVIGQGLLVYSIGYMSPLVVGLTLLTQPLITAVVGWLSYGERLTIVDAIGASLICLALVLIRFPARSVQRRVERSARASHLRPIGEVDDPAQ